MYFVGCGCEENWIYRLFQLKLLLESHEICQLEDTKNVQLKIEHIFLHFWHI